MKEFISFIWSWLKKSPMWIKVMFIIAVGVCCFCLSSCESLSFDLDGFHLDTNFKEVINEVSPN